MKSVSYPLRIDENVMSMVELKAKDEYIDKSTALRKLLYKGIEDYMIELYKEGRISIGKIAEVLGKSIHDMHRILLKHQVRIKHDENILVESRTTAKKIFE